MKEKKNWLDDDDEKKKHFADGKKMTLEFRLLKCRLQVKKNLPSREVHGHERGYNIHAVVAEELAQHSHG